MQDRKQSVLHNTQRRIEKSPLKAVTAIPECKETIDNLVKDGQLYSWFSKKLKVEFLSLEPLNWKQKEKIVNAHLEADRRAKSQLKKTSKEKLPNLNAGETATFRFLESWISESGFAYCFKGGRRKLARYTGNGEATIKRHIDKLESEGYIWVIRDETADSINSEANRIYIDFPPLQNGLVRPPLPIDQQEIPY